MRITPRNGKIHPEIKTFYYQKLDIPCREISKNQKKPFNKQNSCQLIFSIKYNGLYFFVFSDMKKCKETSHMLKIKSTFSLISFIDQN
tara:strand:- start:94 stop:357 length:264 start_codon:yes stop_codon:yes gene_type:complete